jgi:hypothetical protein
VILVASAAARYVVGRPLLKSDATPAVRAAFITLLQQKNAKI